jgi:hypothetical protein
MVLSHTSKCRTFLQAGTLISGQVHEQNSEEFVFFLTAKERREIYLKAFVIIYVDRQFQLTAVQTKARLKYSGTPSKHDMHECYCPTLHIITKIIITLGNRICLIC